MDERLVAVEQAVPPGEQVALEPALALVLAEHLQHAAGAGQVLVDVGAEELGVPLLVGDVWNTDCRRFDAVSSGPKIRKLSGLAG